MVYVYPNTISTFTGSEETAIKAGYIKISDEVYADLVETKKKWDNGVIVDDPTYPERKAEEEAEKERQERINAIKAEVSSCKARLRELDYIGIKIATGRATREEYAEQIAEMNTLAQRINELENEVE